jgi:hypothetical protein
MCEMCGIGNEMEKVVKRGENGASEEVEFTKSK